MRKPKATYFFLVHCHDLHARKELAEVMTINSAVFHPPHTFTPGALDIKEDVKHRFNGGLLVFMFTFYEILVYNLFTSHLSSN